MTVSPVRLNHAVLFVADVDRATRFYAGVFGMDVVSREAGLGAAFLRLPRSGNHHDLGLFEVRGALPAPRRSVGLYHLAWQLDTVDELVELRRVLLESGSYTGESSHGATKSVYGADPDGNQFEIMWMLPRAEWGRYESAAIVERLDLAAEYDRWSGVHTAGELQPLTDPGSVAQSTTATATKEH
jgi:catechol-2,3-dioxygenase